MDIVPQPLTTEHRISLEEHVKQLAQPFYKRGYKQSDLVLFLSPDMRPVAAMSETYTVDLKSNTVYARFAGLPLHVDPHLAPRSVVVRTARDVRLTTLYQNLERLILDAEMQRSYRPRHVPLLTCIARDLREDVMALPLFDAMNSADALTCLGTYRLGHLCGTEVTIIPSLPSGQVVVVDLLAAQRQA
jgi:hypothetical protein